MDMFDEAKVENDTPRFTAAAKSDVAKAMADLLGANPAYCNDYASSLDSDLLEPFTPLPISREELTAAMRKVAALRKVATTRANKPRVPKGELP